MCVLLLILKNEYKLVLLTLDINLQSICYNKYNNIRKIILYSYNVNLLGIYYNI